MPLPITGPLLAAFAPAIIDHFTGKGTKAKPAIPEAVLETLADVTKQAADHEHAKASVRPAIMRRMGNLTLLQTAVVGAIGVCYAFGWGIEDWERAAGAAMIVTGGAGVSGGSYLWGHTARSIEKNKGAEK